MDMPAARNSNIANRKTIRISEKRQLTIPQKFFEALGFSSEAECILRGNELVIRPVKKQSGGEFAEQILADLIKQGFTGEKLLKEFKKTQKKVRPAVEAMLAQAEQAAHGESESFSYDDVFGTEEK
ncbi:MAG TPA: AbrB/MazE/SpoVT family DNA-binding domain-containing protein [Firmicutes bacterium]|nr:AbrB/MazE/SpoVT family DNA-binding domain-containing protein [Bacillota bacterium]